MGIRLNSKEQKELVLKNRKLVFHVAKRFVVPFSDYDEIVSVGKIGLIKAAGTYDKSKNITFATYACMCIRNEILMYFRKEKRRENEVSLDEPIDDDGEGNEITLLDTTPNPDRDFVEEFAQRDIIERLISIVLNLLNERKRLIMLYRIAGMSQEVIAEALNISRSYVSRLENQLKSEVKLYFTTSQEFKKIFRMAIVDDYYKISFSSKDVNHFNFIFATFLQNQTSTEKLPDFNVICNNGRIIIQVPAHPESFYFIAQIIRQIDDYNIKLVSNKNCVYKK